MDWLTFVPASALASIIVAGYLYHYVNRQDSGSDRMREIAEAIRIGANAYLRRQNSALAVFAGVMAVILGLAFSSFHLSLAYLLGALCTAVASYFGMNAAVRANVRTANGAVKGLSRALPV
ncbi:MAG: sodium/proton-translocating pyrophosphatase, partial [Candidatus Bathyarchaeia archaeon]